MYASQSIPIPKSKRDKVEVWFPSIPIVEGAPTHRKVQMPTAQVVNNTAILIFELFIYFPKGFGPNKDRASVHTSAS
jgi:hypothetical protein